MKKSSFEAFKLLVLPLFFGSVLFTTLHMSLGFYIIGQVFGVLFFAQCFILMHEFGHRSMFKNTSLNIFFGHIASFFVFIPYFNWLEIHDLHHLWTGYRDKDPTTEKTFVDRLTPTQQKIINLSWKFYIPVFTIGYRFGIYWKAEKLKRHLNSKSYKRCLLSMTIYGILYLIVIILFPKTVFLLLPAIIFSFNLTDLISLSQHSHIRMLNSEGEKVTPLKYVDQIKYTRSLILPKFISKYLFFNINYHEAHHAYPGLPCYHLSEVNIKNINAYQVLPWLKKVKCMSGVDFVFNSDPNRVDF